MEQHPVPLQFCLATASVILSFGHVTEQSFTGTILFWLSTNWYVSKSQPVMFIAAYPRMKDFPGASHDMLYTLTFDFMEMTWEKATSIYAGDRENEQRMSSKSGCLKQWEDPMPKG
uniref:Uncharacterized protein n=1 Tax=Oryza brachyantha TaxID=4533 RepID=J3LWN9_ORYBR